MTHFLFTQLYGLNQGMSFIEPMKDKTVQESRRNVFHRADEGQNGTGKQRNVLHKADEGQKATGKQDDFLS
ncbi:hypothetical protein KW850_23045 [Bacillus sp. sid0103]|uniref:hypothetical protein n=1 Tax=Bacillus sp. sid0103 TaxID=2856337 RepID=UPI001C43850B|nr:hypothetical protein [Bacillus sp. sid0103]MBV7508099.1 hypothetical protein [Bacillus sp. sid0103]